MMQKVFSPIRIFHKTLRYAPRCYCKSLTNIETTDQTPKYDIVNTKNIAETLDNLSTTEKQSVLKPCKEDLTHVAPYLKPTYNFAAYINKSETLQELYKLGVDLHKLECKKDVPPYVMQLEFEKDIKPHVEFLHNFGLGIEAIGQVITKNPFIFKERLEDLQVRINYLKAKRFTDEMILRILEKNPFWLSFTTQSIDEFLGFFQKEFKLSGTEVREVASKSPKLITFALKTIKLNIFVLKEEMMFTPEQMKKILLKKPNVYKSSQHKLLKAFEYVHKEMGISTDIICEFPDILTHRAFRIKQRHLFLKQLDRDQYDPNKPNYVSLLSLVSGSDADFATEIAKSSIQTFNSFLKTL